MEQDFGWSKLQTYRVRSQAVKFCSGVAFKLPGTFISSCLEPILDRITINVKSSSYNTNSWTGTILRNSASSACSAAIYI